MRPWTALLCNLSSTVEDEDEQVRSGTHKPHSEQYPEWDGLLWDESVESTHSRQCRDKNGVHRRKDKHRVRKKKERALRSMMEQNKFRW